MTSLSALSKISSFMINLDFCLAGGHIQICQPGQQTCSKGRLYEGKEDGACFCPGMHVEITLSYESVPLMQTIDNLV